MTALLQASEYRSKREEYLRLARFFGLARHQRMWENDYYPSARRMVIAGAFADLSACRWGRPGAGDTDHLRLWFQGVCRRV